MWGWGMEWISMESLSFFFFSLILRKFFFMFQMMGEEYVMLLTGIVCRQYHRFPLCYRFLLGGVGLVFVCIGNLFQRLCWSHWLCSKNVWAWRGGWLLSRAHCIILGWVSSEDDNAYLLIESLAKPKTSYPPWSRRFICICHLLRELSPCCCFFWMWIYVRLILQVQLRPFCSSSFTNAWRRWLLTNVRQLSYLVDIKPTIEKREENWDFIWWFNGNFRFSWNDDDDDNVALFFVYDDKSRIFSIVNLLE